MQNELKNIPVWTYWEGHKPDWIALCLETLKKNIPDIEILTPDLWNKIYTGYPIRKRRIARQDPTVKSNFIRAWLLHHHGGYWIDADCIMFRDIRHTHKQLKRKKFIKSVGGCGIVGSVKKGKLAEAYLKTETEYIRAKRKPRRRVYGSGPARLRKTIRENKQLSIAKIDSKLIHPVWYTPTERLKFLIEKPDNEHLEMIPHNAYCMMLTHLVPGPLAELTRMELLASKTFLGYCYRRALNMPLLNDLNDEIDLLNDLVDEELSVKDVPIKEIRHKLIANYIVDKNVLDLGSLGTPHRTKKNILVNKFLFGTMARISKNIIGLDINTDAIDRLPKRDYLSLIKQADVYSKEEIKQAVDIDIDVIVCGELLEHLINPGIVLTNLRELFPHATLVVTVPNCLTIVPSLEYGYENIHDDHVCYYSPRTITKLLEKTGWHVKETIPCGISVMAVAHA